ncbi:MAG TPA: hypothetical protein VFP84_14395 [Kofleriaceae bacterium]|nr:hypothetical protein [Kofleriaceae bacterium]
MPRVRRLAGTRRAKLALIACLLWLAGVEALPAVHEATHAHFAPHRHVAGSIVVSSFEDTTHRHPDGTIHFVAPGAKHKRAADGRAHVRGDLGHADGLAHHAAAIAPAAPPVTKPLPVDRRPIVLAVSERVEPVAIDPLAAVARGPPASSSSRI